MKASDAKTLNKLVQFRYNQTVIEVSKGTHQLNGQSISMDPSLSNYTTNAIKGSLQLHDKVVVKYFRN